MVQAGSKKLENFAKILSKFGDIYVNDAFSCSHRAHASVTKITDYLPSFCGLQMDQQILMNHLNLQIGQKWMILQKIYFIK